MTQLTYESHYSVYTAACLYSQSLTCLLGFSCVPEIYLSLTQDVLFTCMTRLNIKQDCTKLDTCWPSSRFETYVCCTSIYRNKNDLKDPKNQTEGPVMLIFWSFACRLTIIELPQSNTSNLKIVIKKKKKHFWPQKCLWMCLFSFFLHTVGDWCCFSWSFECVRSRRLSRFKPVKPFVCVCCAQQECK